MLSDDSILRRIPAALEPKQALFVDGIRHAVEIMELAYGRLKETLTNIALDPPTSADLRKVGPHAFLDAWAMVDAVDRFRMLYQQMPGIKFGPPVPGIEPLKTVTQPFRDLRNVADHLSQRADFVVARGGAALGTLTWLTGFKLDPPTIWFCTLRPGTIRSKPEFRKEPVFGAIDWPTDKICLNAGGYEGNLSAIRPHIERRVKHFEIKLKDEFERHGIADGPAANDVFMRQPYQLSPGQFPWKD
ncbi:MAG: hypothetical protein WB870_02295 [Gallionellaceae bacterium]